jgi:hypothetical protein
MAAKNQIKDRLKTDLPQNNRDRLLAHAAVAGAAAVPFAGHVHLFQ